VPGAPPRESATTAARTTIDESQALVNSAGSWVPDRAVSSLYTATPDANGVTSIAVNGSAVKPAIDKRPIFVTAEMMIDLRFRQFLRSRHMCLQNGLGFYLSFAQTKLAALFRSPVLSYFATLG